MTTETPQINTRQSGAGSVTTSSPEPPPTFSSPWLTVKEAAERARCGVKTVYREVAAGRLKAARIGGRRELRFLADWIDQWLSASTSVSS
jgi:excisionase family DNA binding protein